MVVIDSSVSFGHKYSVDFSFDKEPFLTYPVASFSNIHDAYNWLLDLHKLILRDHIIQITDSDGDVVFNLSYFFDYDDDLKGGYFKTTQHWLVNPEDLEPVVYSDLPF